MRLKKIGEHMSVKKAAVYAIVINSMQIGLILFILALIVISPQFSLSQGLMRFLVGIAALVIIWGAVMDIREASSTVRLIRQLDDMDDTIEEMEKLNNTLRSQRHDFLNHLQVVYSLMEMEEYAEANQYIEKIYGQITAVSQVMRTASAPVNALLQVKAAACKKAGISLQVNITSSWKELPVPGWEMCKVLSNLIDNAMDAVIESPENQRLLTVELKENLKEFAFSVANTGAMIPESARERIFDAGVTTKRDGHGMGLYIVRETLGRYGGTIRFTSDAQETVFFGAIPKEPSMQEAMLRGAE